MPTSPEKHRSRATLWLTVASSLMMVSAANAGGFAAGVRAYDSGDFSAAFTAWLPLAQAGNVAAMRNIGNLYRLGRGVAQDDKQASAWYRRAALLGFSHAQTNLAEMYLTGAGVDKDPATAAQWFERAAKNDDPLAQYSLAELYEQGLGVPQDNQRAAAWYQRAAAADFRDAATRLNALNAGTAAADAGPAAGKTPATGSDGSLGASVHKLFPARPPAPPQPSAPTPTPIPIAVSSPATATAAIAPIAAGLGAYERGDYQQALAHWLPAARQGDAQAQYLVGKLFRDGDGVPPDRVNAQMWFTLAARQGDTAARQALADLAPRLTPSQQAAAQALIAAWDKN